VGKERDVLPLFADTIELETTYDLRSGAGGQPGGRVRIVLTPISQSIRHQVQRDEISGAFVAANVGPPRPIDSLGLPVPINGLRMAMSERYRLYQVSYPLGQTADNLQSFARKQIFRDSLYLFNVLVAFEWVPSCETLNQLLVGARAASDFLFEATDGQMAVGQITIGGRPFMPAADIQIMASSRFHPRSWTNALNDERKFSPVRLGRGLWSKNRSSVIPWDAPEGYRTIIHEWGHYALNLLDEYLSSLKVQAEEGSFRLRAPEEGEAAAENTFQLFVPGISLPVESIMASLEGTSKIVPSSLTERKKLERSYPGVIVFDPPTPGPSELPLSLPSLYQAMNIDDLSGDEVWIDPDPLTEAVGVDHCWLYLLRFDNDDNLIHVIAQGSLDARAFPSDANGGSPSDRLVYDDQECRLLGAQAGAQHRDRLVAIGYTRDGVTTRNGLLEIGQVDAQTGRRSATIADISPAAIVADPPLVVVRPKEGEAAWNPFTLDVQINEPVEGVKAWLAEPGRSARLLVGDGPRWTSPPAQQNPRRELDGVIVLRLGKEAPFQYWIADYSHGGGPPTNGQSPQGVPITAGSSEGNALIFFPKTKYKPFNEDPGVKVVTTRNFGNFPGVVEADKARSYVFSVAANRSVIPDPAEYKVEDQEQEASQEHSEPTLVLFFDRDAIPGESQGAGDETLLIHRWNGDRTAGPVGWTRLPTFVPPGRFYAATPLTDKTAPRLVSKARPADGWIEYYQLRLGKPEE
jgi:hypothetical protein